MGWFWVDKILFYVLACLTESWSSIDVYSQFTVILQRFTATTCYLCDNYRYIIIIIYLMLLNIIDLKKLDKHIPLFGSQLFEERQSTVIISLTVDEECG